MELSLRETFVPGERKVQELSLLGTFAPQQRLLQELSFLELLLLCNLRSHTETNWGK